MSIDQIPRFSPLGYAIIALLILGCVWVIWSILAMPIGTLLLFAFGITLGYVLGRA